MADTNSHDLSHADLSVKVDPQRLMELVERIVALFHPRLVLGASDEVPQGADPAEAIARVRMISEWCREETTCERN